MRAARYLCTAIAVAILAGCSVPPIANSEESNKTVYVSPDTADPLLKAYLAEFQTRVAAGGESNFPRISGVPVYGSAVLAVTISKDGNVEAVHVIQSSSDDIAAGSEHLVRKLQPYRPFPSELRQRAARLVLVARLNYSK